MSTKTKLDREIKTQAATMLYMARYRLLIVAFLMVILLALVFYVGVLYSCEGGYLDGLRCAIPKNIICAP